MNQKGPKRVPGEAVDLYPPTQKTKGFARGAP
jgi:hypothetical protein